MSAAPLTQDVALRIGLAARALPDTAASLLVNILLQAVGTPITANKLAKLRKGKLVAAADGALDAASDAELTAAVGFLKGRGIQLETEALPAIASYREGDMPRSIRIACTSNTGDRIDGHFGSCTRFLIYQVSASDLRLIDIRNVPAADPDADKNLLRAQLISDCHVLCTSSIGGPATAKVVRAGLHPMKLKDIRPAPDMMLDMQRVLQNSPPPWLAKIMGEQPQQYAKYAAEGG